MILTVTLNAALDRTVAVPRMGLGNRHRVVDSRTTAGGKGVNIARALRRLGEPVIATGMAAGPTGQRIRELLDGEHVLYDFVEVRGDSRTNLSIVDPTSGVQTEINERGPQVTEDDFSRFKERLLYLASGADTCVIAGSLPPGLAIDAYADLIERLREAGLSTVLDTDGEPMRAALRGGPEIIAPNVGEAEEVVGYEFSEPEDLTIALAGLVEMGAGEAIITTDSGCVGLLGKGPRRECLKAEIEPLAPIAGTGSGDAFVAGLVSARRRGRDSARSLATGVACGAESTQHLGAGTVDHAEVEKLRGEVTVSHLDTAARAA